MGGIIMNIIGTILLFTIMLVFLAVGLYIYILPTMIAYKKWHRNRIGIFCLNVLLGWTFIGWVACLVWALYKEEIKVNTTHSNDKYEELEKLQKLKDSGVITEVEFEVEKQKLLR